MAKKKTTDVWERAAAAAREIRTLLENPDTFERDDLDSTRQTMLETMRSFVSTLASSLEWDVQHPDLTTPDHVSQTVGTAEGMATLVRKIASRSVPIPDVFKNGGAMVPTNHVTYALMQAAAGKGWQDNDGKTVPMHLTKTGDGRTLTVVTVGPNNGTDSGPNELLPSLWEKVWALDDLCSDTLLVCLAQWAARAEGPNTPVRITADAILDARGVQRIKKKGEPRNWQHGHRREQRLAAGRALAQLSCLWIQLVGAEVKHSGRGHKAPRLNIESSPALAILGRSEQMDLNGNVVFLSASVMPGDWAREYWNLGLKQMGLLAQRALAYDPRYQQAEKRIAKYLAFHFRWNASKTGPLRRHVETLVEASGITIEKVNHGRTRKRFEEALDALRMDGVIGDWSYVVDPDTRLPARAWLPEWLRMTVSIEPSEVIRDQYARLRSGTR